MVAWSHIAGKSTKGRCGAVLVAVFVAAMVLGFSASASAQAYPQMNLLSVVLGKTNPTDPHVLQSWSISRSPTSPWLVNSTIGGLSLSFNVLDTTSPVLATIQLPNRQQGAPVIGIVFWYE